MSCISKCASELHHSLELLKGAQITADYRVLADCMAGPLVSFVHQVFPGHLLLVYLLTDIKRRQVWNACLCSAPVAGLLPDLRPGETAQLRHQLLTARSRDLVQQAYGPTEQALVRLYGKLGPVALPAAFYRKFHELLSANVGLRRSLSHLPVIEPRLLELLFDMPTELQSYAFARELFLRGRPETFLSLHQHILTTEFSGKAGLVRQLHLAAQQGGDFQAALSKIFQAVPFDMQVVPNGERLRFFATGSDLVEVGKRFRNCLASQVSNALSGEYQFYEWFGEPPAIVCLRRYRGDTWYISAIKLAENEEPAPELDKEIRAHFAGFGVCERECIADLFDRFLSEPVDESEELAELAALQAL